MTGIRQFRFGADNLGYLLYGDREAIAIDGGAAEEILQFVRARSLSLTVVTNTHGHPDHTTGNRRLLSETGARLLRFPDLPDGGKISLDGLDLLIHRTPGHSEDSVCFHAGAWLMTGDTLFNGTVGNCFTGDLKGFYRSIKRIMALPVDTIVYAGHDYVRDSMAYAKTIEPGNRSIDHFLERYRPDHVCSTLRDEFAMNPFLRMNEPAIVARLRKDRLPCETEWERWESLMKMD